MTDTLTLQKVPAFFGWAAFATQESERDELRTYSRTRASRYHQDALRYHQARGIIRQSHCSNGMDSTEVKGQSAKYEPLGTSQSWPGAAAISSQKNCSVIWASDGGASCRSSVQ